MIHQVPMKSLPQEWLWCETWCDDASKPAAKTIDLVSSQRIDFQDIGTCRIFVILFNILQVCHKLRKLV